MLIQVAMQVTGVEFDDYEAFETLDAELPEVLWASSEGVTTVTVFAEQGKIVSEAIHAARCIEHHYPGASVLRVDPDLVSASDIAHRVGVSREAVRKWASLANFPVPLGATGGDNARAMRIWQWADVVSWLRTERSIEMDEYYPDAQDIQHINACLARVPKYIPARATSPHWAVNQVIEDVSAVTVRVRVKTFGAAASEHFQLADWAPQPLDLVPTTRRPPKFLLTSGAA